MQDFDAKVANVYAMSCDIYIITLKLDKLPQIIAGQFAMLQIPNKTELLLRRPLCIAKCDYDNNTVVFAFRILGPGTLALSKLNKDDRIKVIMPLGNGFDIDRYKKVWLVGGGLGVAALSNVPVIYTNKNYLSILGFKNKEDSGLLKLFDTTDNVVTTDDGSVGRKGFVTDVLLQLIKKDKPDCILLCGPSPLVQAIKRCNLKIPIKVSLEKRMACGVGACVSCVCKVQNGNKRVCKDGPIFDISELTEY